MARATRHSGAVPIEGEDPLSPWARAEKRARVESAPVAAPARAQPEGAALAEEERGGEERRDRPVARLTREIDGVALPVRMPACVVLDATTPLPNVDFFSQSASHYGYFRASPATGRYLGRARLRGANALDRTVAVTLNWLDKSADEDVDLVTSIGWKDLLGAVRLYDAVRKLPPC